MSGAELAANRRMPRQKIARQTKQAVERDIPRRQESLTRPPCERCGRLDQRADRLLVDPGQVDDQTTRLIRHLAGLLRGDTGQVMAR